MLVIDGTKSMDFVMADVKARMTQLAIRVRQLVPIARVGVVVFGGKGEPVDMQPLTLSTATLAIVSRRDHRPRAAANGKRTRSARCRRLSPRWIGSHTRAK